MATYQLKPRHFIQMKGHKSFEMQSYCYIRSFKKTLKRTKRGSQRETLSHSCWGRMSATFSCPWNSKSYASLLYIFVTFLVCPLTRRIEKMRYVYTHSSLHLDLWSQSVFMFSLLKQYEWQYLVRISMKITFPKGYIFLLALLLFVSSSSRSNLHLRNGLSLKHNRDYDCENVIKEFLLQNKKMAY